MTLDTTAYSRILELGNTIVEADRRYTNLIRDAAAASGSRAAAAMPDRLASMAYHLAAVNISVSLDHLRTVAIVVQAGRIPAYALTSLLRTGHECALVARWLTDEAITDEERVARGVGSQYSDLEERRKFETSTARPAPTVGKLASARIADLMNEAAARGFATTNKKGLLLPSTPQPNIVELFDRFESTELRPGSWLYRYYSGFAHGKQWATTLGAKRASPSDEHGHSTALLEASDQALVMLMELATGAAVRAVSDFETLYSA